ncbi:MAG: hypothetical protein K2M47_01160 [Clostridiales bacterium]|nr:hypothetical protein [Clostridiales bacterium]
MKNKFDKNDRLIFHATVLADVIVCLYAGIGLIYGIVTIVNGAKLESTETILLGVFVIPIAFIAAFIFWVFIKVFVNMCCDIKLIRNKLYSIDNDYLNSLVTNNQNSEIHSSDEQQVTNYEVNENGSSIQNNQFADKIEKP